MNTGMLLRDYALLRYSLILVEPGVCQCQRMRLCPSVRPVRPPKNRRIMITEKLFKLTRHIIAVCFQFTAIVILLLTQSWRSNCS